jgi:hypothetical protein
VRRLREVPRLNAKENAWILAVDPATKSGWAIFHGSLYKCSGVALNPGDRYAVVERFLAMAGNHPAVAVVETWGAGWKSYEALARTAENRGRWLELLEYEGVPVLGVLTQTWRARLYGRGYSNRNKTTTAMYKKLAIDQVKRRLKLDVGHDEAEAILIGIWASFARDVAAILFPETENAMDKKVKEALRRLK